MIRGSKALVHQALRQANSEPLIPMGLEVGASGFARNGFVRSTTFVVFELVPHRFPFVDYYLILVVVIVLFTLMLVFHDQIVNWLSPFTDWLKRSAI